VCCPGSLETKKGAGGQEDQRLTPVWATNVGHITGVLRGPVEAPAWEHEKTELGWVPALPGWGGSSQVHRQS
jgi:hypothetical protein